jgi:hypothetical protein
MDTSESAPFYIVPAGESRLAGYRILEIISEGMNDISFLSAHP